MIQVEDKKQCCGCTACYNVCPVNAIIMETDNEGFLYPTVDQSICIGCNKCNNICPMHMSEPQVDLEQCFAGFNKNASDRSESSSGGIFVLLSKNVICQGGIVYGAEFDESNLVCHASAETYEQLYRLIGSKYLQSRLTNIFKDVKVQLESGRKVLFAGTTCQVAGLKMFLSKEYTNLLCVDFICLGVPSPKVWSDYLTTYFSNYDIKHINFKDKSNGWHNFTLRIEGKNRILLKIGRHTKFFRGYFKGLYSRPSCSQCKFKGCKRVSDITISDCWGYAQIAPELDDNKGLSCLIVHTENGLKAFKEIKKGLIYKNASIEDIKKYNDNYCTSKPMGVKRKAFWHDYNKLPKRKLFMKYCSPDEIKLKIKIKKFLKRLKITWRKRIWK